MNNAYAEVTTVSMKKSFYTVDEKISFFGTENEGGSIVTVIVRGPDGHAELLGGFSDPQGEYETTPRNVNSVFSATGIYTITAFTDVIENGVTIQLEFDGTKVTDTVEHPETSTGSGPEDCTSDQVWQNNACVDSIKPPKNDLNLQTDLDLYGQGDVVVISGVIHNYEIGPGDVAIIGRGPDNNIFTVIQVHPNSDGSFQTSFDADGPQFIASGDYTVLANFAGLKSQITFEFTGGTGEIIGGDSQTCTSGQILINGKCVGDDSQIDDSIIVTTDKTSYKNGDTIFVIGEVGEILSGYPVSFRILAPNGNLVTLSQLDVGSDKTFSTEFTAGGVLMRDSGTYTIQVLYGTESRSDETTFTFGGSTSDDLPNEEIVSIPIGTSSPGCEVNDECFTPFVVAIASGGTVVWENNDSAAHTVTGGTPTDGPSGTFDSSLIMAGASFENTFDEAGNYDYFCMVHPWMVGLILVGEGTYIPPQPEDDFDLQVIMENKVYDLSDTATINFSIDGTSAPQNVALEISDPRGTSVISRSFMVDSQGISFEFKIDENFKTGTYKVVATTSNNGNTVSDTAYFKVKSQYNSFKITSVQVTDQQGNPSNLQKGEIGFIKVNLDASKNITTLVTVNLFDSDLTSIGIGSIKTTLSSGNSEIILSFMIPSDVAVGSSNIYVNAFSDWPSNGGIPLTGEISVTENIE